MSGRSYRPGPERALARSGPGARRAGALLSTAPIVSTLVFIVIVLLAVTGMVMTTAPGSSSAAARHEQQEQQGQHQHRAIGESARLQHGH